MPKVIFVILLAVVSLVASIVGHGPLLYAEVCHDQIKPMLVHLHANAQVKSGPNATNFVDSVGTGFLVSNDGLVLTTYHLINDLGDIETKTLTTEARIIKKDDIVNHKDTTPVKAAVIDAVVSTDLMLLKLPPPPNLSNSYPTVKLGLAITHDDSKPIFTSGFPKDLVYRRHDGKIETRSGPGGYLWGTDLKILYGESGSPVYNEKCEVIGIVKGEENDIGYFIPIGFADTLLVQIRLNEIRRDFEVLRQKFDWRGDLIGGFGDRGISLKYEKSVAGEPQVTSIDVQITPIVLTETGREAKVGPFPGNSHRTSLTGEAVGIFNFPKRWDFEQICEDMGYDEIKEIQVDIIPTLSDGAMKQRNRILVEYPRGIKCKKK